ncbi:MAG: glycosyltransferase family 4 protein [Rhodospirillaceae bacterium]
MTAPQKLRLLTFSTLFPNAASPHHGVFVENRLRHLLASGEAESRVIAPVPWFPSANPRFGAYAAHAAAPRHEERYGVDIDHPRYPLIPRIGMSAAPILLYLWALPAVRRLLRTGYDFDLIDAHYFYPDGVAAALIARRLGKPLTITARGTDINLIPAHTLPRRQILWAADRADGMITVCQALKDEMVGLGIAGDRITVLRNGVDLGLFRLQDRSALRARYGLEGPTLISVGHLIERKAHHLVIEALPHLPGFRLLIAGEGPEEQALRALADRLGVADRVGFLGRRPHGELPDLYGAADILVLASSREGWANVLLEAMACGTPVVASNVWGTPEVVAAPEAGRLMRERSGAAIAEGVKDLFAVLPDRAATRKYAEGFSWDATTEGQLDLFRSILARRA